MGAVTLTIEEAAELYGVSYQNMLMKVRRGSIHAVKVDVDKSKSRLGYEYRIELDDLSEKAQRKYYDRMQNKAKELTEVEKKRSETLLEDLTDNQKKDAIYWQEILEAWEKYIAGEWKNKTRKTEEFVQKWNETHCLDSEKKISVRTLNRKREQYRANGIVGLADFRGSTDRACKSRIPEEFWNIFCLWWLDEAKPSVTTVYNNLQKFIELNMPERLDELPTYKTFYNNSKKIPKSVTIFFREGSKALDDECMPFLRRMYDDIDSNDIWSADYHTLDFFVRDDVTGRVFRPHASVWIDVKSRKVLSIVLCENSNSDGVVSAFRKAAEQYGLPRQVYLDNGREYLVSDFGGRGRRKTDSNAEYGLTILERCGIKMYNATVRNGKTKVIERIFAEVKNEFSKLVSTYVGGKPSERPERMKKLNKVLEKEENVPLLSDIKKQIELYIEGIYNERESSGMGMNGKCPNDVYAENLIKKRVATSEELNIMLMRTARLQSVGRNGVLLKFGDTKLDYWDEYLVEHYEGKKVFVRYDIEHLGEVRVDDEKGSFICTAKLRNNGGYALGTDFNLDAIKELNHQKKIKRQQVKNYMEDTMKKVDSMKEMGIEVPEDMQTVVTAFAEHTIKAKNRTYEAEILEPIMFQIPEDEEETVDVDISRMVQNAMNR